MLISRHAAERWIERIDPTADIAKAEAAIGMYRPVIDLGISLKARAVKLGCGAKLVLQGNVIVTVLAKGGRL